MGGMQEVWEGGPRRRGLYIDIYRCIDRSLSLSLSIYIYIHIHIKHTHTCTHAHTNTRAHMHTHTHTHTHTYTASQVVLVVKNLPANAVDMRDLGLIPESGRCPGGGYDNPLQYSCWENPVDRGAWWATVHRFAKSWPWLKWLSMHV